MCPTLDELWGCGGVVGVQAKNRVVGVGGCGVVGVVGL